MNKFFFFYVFLFMFQSLNGKTQDLWDDEFLNQQRIFYSVSDALLQPDSVYILNLSKKKLTELPAEIFQLKNLRELIADKNKLTEIPAAIENLSLLQTLSLSNNKLKSIPAQIGKLKNLKFLHLNRNVITEIPVEIGTLFNLEEMHVWDNEINNIADEIRFCSSLRILELRGILFSEEQQKHIHDLLPYTKVYFSPSCNCKN